MRKFIKIFHDSERTKSPYEIVTVIGKMETTVLGSYKMQLHTLAKEVQSNIENQGSRSLLKRLDRGNLKIQEMPNIRLEKGAELFTVSSYNHITSIRLNDTKGSQIEVYIDKINLSTYFSFNKTTPKDQMLKTIIDLTNFINKVKYDANLFPNETKMNLLNAEYEFPKKYATFIEFLRKNNIDILK